MSKNTTNCLTYSVKEISYLLGISVAKAYDLIRKNIIPNLKLDGRYVVPVNPFHKWLDDSCKAGDFI